LGLQNESSVNKCRVVRHGNRSKESFVQVIAVFCLKDLRAVLQKIPLALSLSLSLCARVCVCVYVCMRARSTVSNSALET
jgi:hypothetical protein